MERVFANLYRMGAPNRRGTSYSYLLVRKEGNLLVAHQSAPSRADIAEIKKLGGIESQWVCHQHDTLTDGAHEDLHDRFGCVLHHHTQDRPAVRKKTKCPVEQHGNEGLQYAPDFEVMYWPTCTSGHCIFRWRSRGKYYLFTSHAIYAQGNKWELQFNPRRMDQIGPQLSQLAKAQVDYVFPGYSPADESGFYRLNDQTRKSLAKAMKAAA
ncbi:MAG: hypothetical protein HOM68_15310 [Gemmatimonadetes bacterium]|jgi:hypothetical protein|nr:hypothetical protein [Gemmatimonadota bacterium]MBT4609489.1 hypothetical protein [Gemmatimonadota bacterium]MBT5057910.1 hypothetical protein [Gemmatimonadota bacterium]MBT5144350.1 hypothetical protein [Gemmatimonadota bacterium]MBT5587132.1 hypothetical protein [Gemmatimonadota bacterium]